MILAWLRVSPALLAEHRRRGALERGTDITLAVGQVLVEDATGSMTCMQFEALDVERVAVGLAVLHVDHNVLQIDDYCTIVAPRRGSASPPSSNNASPTPEND
jgi:hypothetical protein